MSLCVFMFLFVRLRERGITEKYPWEQNTEYFLRCWWVWWCCLSDESIVVWVCMCVFLWCSTGVLLSEFWQSISLCIFPLIESIPQGVTACLHADTMKVCVRVCVHSEGRTLQTISPYCLIIAHQLWRQRKRRKAGEEELLIELVRLSIFYVFDLSPSFCLKLLLYLPLYIFPLIKNLLFFIWL